MIALTSSWVKSSFVTRSWSSGSDCQSKMLALFVFVLGVRVSEGRDLFEPELDCFGHRALRSCFFDGQNFLSKLNAEVELS
jgi:hypothetical protein